MNPVIRRCGVAALPLLSAVGFTVMLTDTAWAQASNQLLPVVCVNSVGALSTSGLCFTDPGGLADTAEPGSVLVFPKISEGTVTVDAGGTNPFTAPKTEIELGAVCPTGTTNPGQISGTFCPPNMPIRIHLHWVCEPFGITTTSPTGGPNINQTSAACSESDTYISMTVNGKLRFAPNIVAGWDGQYPVGSAATVYPDTAGFVSGPACATGRGYLIAFVVDEFNRPIKWDGLIGDVVQRNTAGGATATQDLQTYAALAIQADPRMFNYVYPASNPLNPVGLVGVLILLDNLRTPATGLVGLPFDGAPGHYQMVTGQFMADVRYDQDDLTGPFADTFIIMLTLDIDSGAQNVVTTYNAVFFSQNQHPVSINTIQFICWRQVQLTALTAGSPAALTRTQMTLTSGAASPKGVMITSQATQPAVTGGHAAGRATLLALIQTTEGPAGGSTNYTRSYTSRPYNNSVPVPTTFYSGNF